MAEHRTQITEIRANEAFNAMLQVENRIPGKEREIAVMEIDLDPVLAAAFGADKAVVYFLKGQSSLMLADSKGNRKEFLSVNGGCFPLAYAYAMVDGSLTPVVPALYGTWLKIIRELLPVARA